VEDFVDQDARDTPSEDDGEIDA
jgi:ABC-type multidrug transport system fused ATPase/permease subunit